MAIKSKEIWANEWAKVIEANREELKRKIEAVFYNTWLLENDPMEYHGVVIRFDGKTLYRFGWPGFLEDMDLVYEVYSVDQFICTNGRDSNYTDCLTEEERISFEEWRRASGCFDTMKNLIKWQPNILQRVKERHRSAIIEFDANAVIDNEIRYLRNGEWTAVENHEAPASLVVDVNEDDSSDEIDVSEESKSKFWKLFGDGAQYGPDFTWLETNEMYYDQYIEYDSAFGVLNGFRGNHESVPLTYRQAVSRWLKICELYNAVTRERILQECTYSEMADILYKPISLFFHMDFNADKFQCYYACDPSDASLELEYLKSTPYSTEDSQPRVRTLRAPF